MAKALLHPYNRYRILVRFLKRVYAMGSSAGIQTMGVICCVVLALCNEVGRKGIKQ